MKPLDANKQNNRIIWKLTAPLGVVAASLLLSTPVMADDTQSWPAILRSSDGKVVHNNFGECWHLGANHMANFPTPECGQAAPPAPEPMAAAAPPPPPPAPEAPPAAPAPKHITLSTDALFDFDKSVLKPGGKEAIDSELDKANANSATIQSVKVVGNTDSIGTKAYNQKLSERRAMAVKNYLVSKGIDADKITTEGHGMMDPVASNKTAEGRAKNRRADIWIEVTE
jgi:OOP family OmpA-OmpF porin